MKKTIILTLLLLSYAWMGFGQGVPKQQPPLKLKSGETLAGIYFWSYKATPWKQDDQRLHEDLNKIREMGLNTLFSVHGPLEAASSDWKSYDRVHQAAKEIGLSILPGLELQTGLESSEAIVARKFGIEVPKGLTQDGEKKNSLIYKEEFRELLKQYAIEYLQRYLKDGSIVRVMDKGVAKPVIALTFEAGWHEVSFDKETNSEFWHRLYRNHTVDRGSNVGELNFYWGTRYDDFAKIDPGDKAIFDYDFALTGKAHLWRPMAHHIIFRADLVDEALTAVRDELLKQYPDLLFATEIKYPFGAPSREAAEYKWRAALLPKVVQHADIVIVRAPEGLSLAEENWLLKLRNSGRLVILAHEMKADSGYGQDLVGDFYQSILPNRNRLFANAIGFYSWNDMVGSNIVHQDKLQKKMRTVVQQYRGAQ